MKRTFEFVEGKSSKFWCIELSDKSFTVHYGKIGTAGQTQTKSFATEAAAQKEHDKLVAEKLKKGYKETKPAAPDPLREALEKALAENPDDVASHAAYADCLQEKGDPRGEFVQVQLALEDPKLRPAQRSKLLAREAELLKQHGKRWLGSLAPVLTREDSYVFARGWLDTLSFNPLRGPTSLAVPQVPELRLLRRLMISSMEAMIDDDDEWPGGEVPDDFDEDSGCSDALACSPYLGNVRVLRVGEEIDPDFDEGISVQEHAGNVERIVAKMPRLEELYLFVAHGIEAKDLFALPTLTNLRVLQLYHMHKYPFETLGANPAVANLTTLLCHPACYGGNAVRITMDNLKGLCESRHLKKLSHLRLRLTELGDEGVRMIVLSGLIRRLKTLDLRLGKVTDEGARVLAGSRGLKNLELLNLSRNALTPDGVARLQATGVKLNAENQHDDDDDDWFSVGDYE